MQERGLAVGLIFQAGHRNVSASAVDKRGIQLVEHLRQLFHDRFLLSKSICPFPLGRLYLSTGSTKKEIHIIGDE